MKNFEIFKAGNHTPMKGKKAISFTEDDLRSTANAYDPAVHEAPIVIGHPANDGPAYGWVKAIDFIEGSLEVEPDQLDPAFAEMVEAGRFKKVSASFYLPDADNNPVPGSFYLRHVGFLGAQPPAVKGLKPISFTEEESGVVVFGEIEPWDLKNIARLFRRIRETFIDKFSQEEADNVLPDWQISEIEEAAHRIDDKAGAAFTETHTEEDAMKKEEMEKKEQELKDQEASFTERETKLKKKEEKIQIAVVAATRTDAIAFCEALVKEGKLLPVNKDFAVEFMCGLSEETTVEFGEGDDQQKKSQVAGFKDFLTSMPNVVEFSEIASNSKTVNGQGDNDDSHDIARRAVDFQEAEAKAGRTISTAQAVAHVTKPGK